MEVENWFTFKSNKMNTNYILNTILLEFYNNKFR